VKLLRRTIGPQWIWTLPGSRIKAALFIGFGLISATWAFAGYYFGRRVADLELRATSINERYTKAQDLLTTARGQVLVGSVYVRDALLDPDPGTADRYRSKLEEAYQAADQALVAYVPVVDVPAERERIADLRADIDDFRHTVLDVLATDNRLWPREARTLLRRKIMPKRESVIRVADEVQGLNRAAFIRQQNEIASIYRVTQRRLWASFGWAVLVSFGIAILAIGYVGRLEDRLQRQRSREEHNARALRHLSSKLITVQEEERRSIARELHDEVGQALTAIKVELAVAQRAIEIGTRVDVLADVRSITDGALHTVRDMSHLLHPAVLDDLGLVAAVDSHLKRFGRRHAISVALFPDQMEGRLDRETEVTAYRIVQEALTNVAKHSRAQSCRVYLQCRSDTLLVEVEDDGLGFDPARVAGSEATAGLGLIGIRERASRIGGTLRVESAEGKGTRISVELPVQSQLRPADGVDAASSGQPGDVDEVLGG